MNQLDVLLWADDCHGIYCPQYALERLTREQLTGISDEDWDIVLAGPDHEWYWESWDIICSDAIVTLPDGDAYRIEQDGIVWLVPLGMSYTEELGYHWATDEEDEAFEEETN